MGSALGFCVVFAALAIVLGQKNFKLQKEKGGSKMNLFCTALRDMMVTVPAKSVAFVLDVDADVYLVHKLMETFFLKGIMASLFMIKSNCIENFIETLIEDIEKQISFSDEAIYIVITDDETTDQIVDLLDEQNLARRNLLFFFYLGKRSLKPQFTSRIHETLRVSLILNHRYGIFQVLYNQAKAKDSRNFHLVNWWSKREGTFRSPLLPSAYEVYKDFGGRTFNIPVLHKPPWNFVTYNNDSIEVVGGRDDKLLRLLSSKLNFKYEYFDPPDRSQGSAVVNGSMKGVLGLIWQREVEIFIGDLTVTYERSLAVDFSFLTLTDSEAFLTHAPGLLTEALALVRPFNWKVWPAVAGTFLLASPLLFIFFLSSNKWQTHKNKLMYECFWITTSIFLKQNIVVNLKNFHRVRIFIILLYLISTYVIGDMYSANLTSMLAKPAREKPVSTLEQLNNAMTNQDYHLLVEKQSASHTFLENGTGLYKSIWEKMKSQSSYLLNSTEDGILAARDGRRIAVIGGRETFFYNTRRFGIHHFHLSEKLYTRYSAIAVQIGCPFLQNFNEILMALFEAGILTKITEDEYQKLGEKSSVSEQETTTPGNAEVSYQKEEDKELKSMSMKMLQGAFYVLLTGHGFAGLVFIIENMLYCHKKEI